MKIYVVRGDITAIPVDAIVNAANSGLYGGGGVDGAIHRAGGPSIAAECADIRSRQGGCETGNAVHTGAGKLPAKYVIHTVGPIWGAGDDRAGELLAACYRNSLRLAERLGCDSVSFPNISTGVYGCPKEVAVDVVHGLFSDRIFLSEFRKVTTVFFVNFERDNYELYQMKFADIRER